MTMTSSSGPEGPTVQRVDEPSAAGGRPRIEGSLRRLLVWMPIGAVGYSMLWGAIPGIFLPISIQGIDPDNKVAGLALATSIGALAPLIAQPLVGLISDRTRSRFGRRAPWMVIGALLTALSLIGMASANGLVQIVVAWVCVQFFSNFIAGPMSAILPDRVPPAVRGTFAALFGMGAMIGALGGSVVGAQFATRIGTGYFFFAGLVLLLAVLFVVLNPDRSSEGEAKPPFSAKIFFSAFWVNPVKHPDFFLAFMGRLLLGSGYYLVVGYQLYLLQDYIGLGDDAVGFVPLLSLVNLAGTIVTTLVGGPLSDRLGRRKIIVVVAGVVLSLSLLMPWIMPTTLGMILFSLLAGLGFGAFQSVDTALISEVLPSREDFGKDLGVVNIAAALPQILGPAVAGVIVLSMGGYVALFPIGMVISLLGAFVVLPIKSVR